MLEAFDTCKYEADMDKNRFTKEKSELTFLSFSKQVWGQNCNLWIMTLAEAKTVATGRSVF